MRTLQTTIGPFMARYEKESEGRGPWQRVGFTGHGGVVGTFPAAEVEDLRRLLWEVSWLLPKEVIPIGVQPRLVGAGVLFEPARFRSGRFVVSGALETATDEMRNRFVFRIGWE